MRQQPAWVAAPWSAALRVATITVLSLIVTAFSRMVEATIQNLPIDLKRTMFGNIVLAGGTSLLPGTPRPLTCGSAIQLSPLFLGLADRLQKELRTIAPPSVEIRIVDPTNRHLTTWTGQQHLALTAQLACVDAVCMQQVDRCLQA